MASSPVRGAERAGLACAGPRVWRTWVRRPRSARRLTVGCASPVPLALAGATPAGGVCYEKKCGSGCGVGGRRLGRTLRGRPQRGRALPRAGRGHACAPARGWGWRCPRREVNGRQRRQGGRFMCRSVPFPRRPAGRPLVIPFLHPRCLSPGFPLDVTGPPDEARGARKTWAKSRI